MDRKFKVLVIGDIILDHYSHVETTRNAQEANIPIWDVIKTENRLGGAANVALNLKAIGGDEVDVSLAGICDHYLRENLVRVNIDLRFLFDARWWGLIKNRLVDTDGRIIMRYDNKKKFHEYDVEKFWKSFKDTYIADLQYDAIVISDYDKGTIDPTYIYCPQTPLMIVDSKRKDLSIYEGFDILKLNNSEFDIQLANKESYGEKYFETLFSNVVVTKGRKGAELRNTVLKTSFISKYGPSPIEYRTDKELFPVKKALEKDVTGCGDTHTAAMTFFMLKNRDIRKAVAFANVCASKVVEKFGTSIVSKEELGEN